MNIIDAIYKGYKNIDSDLNMNRTVFTKDTLLIVSTIVWATHKIEKAIRDKEWRRVELLKPCPFCGGRADMRYSLDKALIECINTKCKIQPSTWLGVETDSVSKLVKIWNTRNYEE